MKAATNIKIVHESEVQRQHARMPVPARVSVGNKHYPIKNLSAGGVLISDITGEFVSGQQLRLQLTVPFSGFSLDINLDAEIRHYDAGKKTLGCNFINLTKDRISLLQHILKSFIAGDVVTSDEVLTIATRNNFANARRQDVKASQEPSLARQIPGLAIVALIGVLLVCFIAGNLYSSLFLLRSSDAAVTGPAFEVKAAAEGVYRSQIDNGSVTVRKNQVLGTITSEAGRATPLTSPCDCYIVKTMGVDGQRVSAETSILSLIPVNASPLITAQIDSAHVAKMNTQTPAVIHVFGSKTRYTGHITTVESSLTGKTGTDGDHTVTMQIVPDQKLPVDLINRPAVISFQLYDLPFSLPWQSKH
jgi:alginate biosynthesis protein Alg44